MNLPRRLLALIPLAMIACGRDEARVVVVYTALDREFSAPIFARFTAATGVEVRAVFDTESTKSVGLANRIRAESDRPRCDVFWNNEPLHTIALQRDGLLDPCRPAAAADLPDAFVDPERHWFGFAARARVLIVNTELVAEGRRPTSIHDLADPAWRGRTAIAKPLFGTTASHVAALFATWGDERATTWLDTLRDNEVQIQSGNKGCARGVAEGSIAFALTDTDDAIIEREAGYPVAIVYPDQDDGGTLFLPNTVARVRGAPHPDEALLLIEYLLSPEVETRLAEGPSAQIPLNRRTEVTSRVPGPGDRKAMDVELREVAGALGRARLAVEERFLR